MLYTPRNFKSQDHQLVENLTLLSVSTKEQKRYKSEFVTKFEGIVFAIIFT